MGAGGAENGGGSSSSSTGKKKIKWQRRKPMAKDGNGTKLSSSASLSSLSPRRRKSAGSHASSDGSYSSLMGVNGDVGHESSNKSYSTIVKNLLGFFVSPFGMACLFVLVLNVPWVQHQLAWNGHIGRHRGGITSAGSNTTTTTTSTTLNIKNSRRSGVTSTGNHPIPTPSRKHERNSNKRTTNTKSNGNNGGRDADTSTTKTTQNNDNIDNNNNTMMTQQADECQNLFKRLFYKYCREKKKSTSKGKITVERSSRRTRTRTGTSKDGQSPSTSSSASGRSTILKTSNVGSNSATATKQKTGKSPDDDTAMLRLSKKLECSNILSRECRQKKRIITQMNKVIQYQQKYF